MLRLIADGSVVIIALVAVFMLAFKVNKSNRYDTYLRILMAGVTAYAAAKFIGFIWQPEQMRPFEILGVEPGAAYLDNPGFPSDHALFAAFLTMAVWYGTKNKLVTMLMAVATIAMSVGRVLAHVHTATDVIGGVLIAAVGIVWYLDYAKINSKLTIAKKAKK